MEEDAPEAEAPAEEVNDELGTSHLDEHALERTGVEAHEVEAIVEEDKNTSVEEEPKLEGDHDQTVELENEQTHETDHVTEEPATEHVPELEQEQPQEADHVTEEPATEHVPELEHEQPQEADHVTEEPTAEHVPELEQEQPQEADHVTEEPTTEHVLEQEQPQEADHVTEEPAAEHVQEAEGNVVELERNHSGELAQDKGHQEHAELHNPTTEHDGTPEAHHTDHQEPNVASSDQDQTHSEEEVIDGKQDGEHEQSEKHEEDANFAGQHSDTIVAAHPPVATESQWNDTHETKESIEEQETAACEPVIDSSSVETFFKSLRALQDYMKQRNPETGSMDLDRIRQLVKTTEHDMDCLRKYCEITQAQLETVRAPLKRMTDEIVQTIPEGQSGSAMGKSEQELEVDLRQRQIQVQLAKINASLLDGTKLIALTESAAVEANRAVVDAVETAKRLQAELEEKQKKEEEEKRKAEELARTEEAKRIEEEKRAEEVRLEAERKIAAAREAGLIDETTPFAVPIETRYEFDNGVGCIVRAEPEILLPNMITCEVVDFIQADFKYLDREELISNIIEIGPSSTAYDKTLLGAITLVIPHSMTRQQAALREPVIKMEHDLPNNGGVAWRELETTEVVIDGFKDLKLAQTENLRSYGRFAVISRLRKEKIKLKKRGGTVTSKLDERIHFISDEDSFATRERVTLQIQPIDQQSLTELKRRLDVSKTFLCSSSILRIEWTNRSFESTVIITVPVPPNPITQRKLAGTHVSKDQDKRQKGGAGDGDDDAAGGGGRRRESGDDATSEISAVEEPRQSEQAGRDSQAARPSEAVDDDEARRRSSADEEAAARKSAGAPAAGEPGAEDDTKAEHGEGEVSGHEEEHDTSHAAKKKKRRAKKNEESEEMKALWRKPVNWYMGQYGKDTDEDERDQLFVVRMNEKKNRWTFEPYHIDTSGKSDTVRVELPEPVNAFVVFRMTLAAKEKEAELIADELDKILSQKLVTFILKQHAEHACDVVAYVIPVLKREKILRKLADEKFVGPEPSDVFAVREGDRLGLAFRGNIQCVSDPNQLVTIFSSNLDTKFNLKVKENDIYLQKSYDVYRGFVQLRRVYFVLYVPPETKGDAPATTKTKKKKEESPSFAEIQPQAAEKPRKTSLQLEGIDPNSSLSNIPRTSAPGEEVEEEPPVPLFETKMDTLSELLLAFPKNLSLIKAKPPIKAPITYLPAGDPVTPEILRKLCDYIQTDEEWATFVSNLNINSHIINVIAQVGAAEKTPAEDLRYPLLLQWLKGLAKSSNKQDILVDALLASKLDEVATAIQEKIAVSLGLHDSQPRTSSSGQIQPAGPVVESRDRVAETLQLRSKAQQAREEMEDHADDRSEYGD